MKTETHQADIDKRNDLDAATEKHRVADMTLRCAIARLAMMPSADIPVTLLENAVSSAREKHIAEECWHKIPKPRRQAVIDSIATAKLTMNRIATILPHLSGTVSMEHGLGKHLSVCCKTHKGDIYSKKCTYRRNDGHLKVIITGKASLSLQEHENLSDLSFSEGLPLLSVEDTDMPNVFRCHWVKKSRGWDVSGVSGWIAMSGSTIYHSETSAESAAAGLRKKLNSSPQNGSLSHCEQITRRAIRDVTGWCGPGVQSWIERYLPAEHTRRRAVPREVVLESARKDTSTYGRRLVALLTK